MNILLFSCGLIAGYLVSRFLGRDDILTTLSKDSGANEYKEGLEAHLDGKLTRAKDLLQQVITKDPDNIAAYQYLGQIYQATDRPENAVRVLRLALLRPQISLAGRHGILRTLARLYASLDQHAAAIELYEGMTKEQKGNSELWHELADLAIAAKLWDKAHDAAKEYLRLAKISDQHYLSYILTRKAEAMLANNEHKEALKVLKQSGSLTKKFVYPHLILGDYYYAKGDVQKAISEWDVAIKQNRYHAFHVYSRLEKALFEMGDFGRVTAVYNGVLSDFPDSGETHFALSRIYAKKGLESEFVSEINETIAHTRSEDYDKIYRELLLYQTGHLRTKALSPSQIQSFLRKMELNPTHFQCGHCQFICDHFAWQCPNCNEWESLH